MSGVIIRRPVNRLAKLVLAPGGLTVGEALADADARLSVIKDACLAELKILLAQIQTLAHPQGPTISDDQFVALQGLCDEVLSVAPVAGLPDIGLAVHSLCELVDGLRAQQSWSESAVRVHLDGLTLLSEPALGLGPEQTQAVVVGLRQVVQRTLRG